MLIGRPNKFLKGTQFQQDRDMHKANNQDQSFVGIGCPSEQGIKGQVQPLCGQHARLTMYFRRIFLWLHMIGQLVPTLV